MPIDFAKYMLSVGDGWFLRKECALKMAFEAPDEIYKPERATMIRRKLLVAEKRRKRRGLSGMTARLCSSSWHRILLWTQMSLGTSHILSAVPDWTRLDRPGRIKSMIMQRRWVKKSGDTLACQDFPSWFFIKLSNGMQQNKIFSFPHANRMD